MPGEHRDHERELALGGHGQAGDEAIPEVQVVELGRVVEVGHDQPHRELPYEGEREQHADADDLPVDEVLDGDLEADAGREEDAHEPLEEALELRHEVHVDVVVPAEDEAGDEGPHEEGGLGVVRGGHEGEEEEEEEAEARGAVVLRLDPGEEVLVRF